MHDARVSKCDLHVHSKYSDRPSEWFLRRMGTPESFVEPLHVYRNARQNGMDFVTISDHNCIRGALEIAHLPGTFLSNEVTTYFPENGSKVHVLVTGINEEQFRMIQELRADIYRLQEYLMGEDIVCSVAHLLFRVNGRLTIDQFERLLLLFPRFELINGSRDRRAADLLGAILDNLTPEMITEMAGRQGIEPYGPQPWKKVLTAGSDDHSGTYTASAFTKTPLASSVDEYLAFLRRGEHEADGACGGSVLMGHAFYHIAYSYYQDRFVRGNSNRNGKPTLVGQLFERLLKTPSEEGGGSGWSLKGLATRFFVSRQLSKLSETERQLVADFRRLFSGEAEQRTAQPLRDDRRTFRIACHISHTLGYSFLERFIEFARQGKLMESLQTIASLGPVALSMAPYLAAFSTQHKDEPFHKAIAVHFPAAAHLRRASNHKAWITEQCTTILVPTETYRRQLIDNGFEPSKLGVMARGVDTQLFHPSKAVPTFFDRYGQPNRFHFLYVGRISKEKNVDVLVDAFAEVVRRGYQAGLVFVGDGPQRQPLAERCQDWPIAFTGILEGEELARAYASGDCMVFPSTTDTFGNVVLEAQASGLPVIVSDQGGPAEIVRRHDSGIIVDLSQPQALADAMETIMLDADRRCELRKRGLSSAAESRWENVLEDFWSRDEGDSGDSDMEIYRSLDARNSPGVIAMEVA